MFLSMLRHFCPLENGRLDKCPLETCLVGRTDDRTCPLKLVCGPFSAGMFGPVYGALQEVKQSMASHMLSKLEVLQADFVLYPSSHPFILTG